MTLDSLYMLAMHAAHLSDPGEFFRVARPVLIEETGADAILVFFHDCGRECLVAPFLYNLMPHASLEEVVLSYEEPLIKDLLIGRKVYSRPEGEKRLLAGMRSELFLPVMTPDQVLGCLYLGHLEPQAWQAPLVQKAELLCHFLVTPMQRIHWEEHSRRTHDLLNAFREQYLYILDTIPLPALVADPGRDSIEEANLSLLQWLHYSRSSLFNRRLSQVFPDMPVLQQQANLWPPQPTTLQVRDGMGKLCEGRAFVSPTSESYKDRKILVFLPEEMEPGSAAGTTESEGYLYALSHDLKTPIQSLKSYVTLLREEYHTQIPESAMAYVERMEVNLEQMEALITHLLDLSRVGRIETHMESVDSADILKNALDTLSGLLEHRSVNLIIDASLPTIYCDVDQMTRVFTNLITNALKSTAAVSMPSIEIGCNALQGEYEFYVQDNGVGVPAPLQSQIFDLFFSHDGVARHKSTGIGLTIVKRIVERHHGRIWVESQEGKGAIFKFTLPMHSAAEQIALG